MPGPFDFSDGPRRYSAVPTITVSAIVSIVLRPVVALAQHVGPMEKVATHR